MATSLQLVGNEILFSISAQYNHHILLYCVTNTLQLPSFSPRSTYFLWINWSRTFWNDDADLQKYSRNGCRYTTFLSTFNYLSSNTSLEKPIQLLLRNKCRVLGNKGAVLENKMGLSASQRSSIRSATMGDELTARWLFPRWGFFFC